MIKDKRKHIRRPMGYNAWIGTDQDAKPQGCVVSDISHSGAKLAVQNPDKLPDGFKLLLSTPSSVSRKCHIVWRSANQVGVLFEKPVDVRPPRTKTLRPTGA